MEQKPMSFTLTIHGTQANEWQGTLQTPRGETLPFASVLELLKALHVQVGLPEQGR